MNDLTISDVDGTLLEAIERRAKKAGKPVDAQVVELLRFALSIPPQRLDAIEEFRRIRAMTPEGVQQTPAVQLIREDRDR